MTVSGESGDVSGLTVESWKERIPRIVRLWKDGENVFSIVRILSLEGKESNQKW